MSAEQANNPDQRRAVVLLSGGLDSATVLSSAIAEGYATYALSFDYGQRQRCRRIKSARQQNHCFFLHLAPCPAQRPGSSFHSILCSCT